MAENLMETQTGGAGETTQLAPETPVTPEQFDVQLPNVGQQEQTAPPVPADSEPTAAPPVEPPVPEAPVEPTEPPTTPPSPVVQESILDVNKQGLAPIVSQVPLSEAKQPLSAGVGYVDWFSGDATKSLEDEENKTIEEMMQKPEIPSRILTRNELDEIMMDEAPIILDGMQVGGGRVLEEDEDGVMPGYAVEDFDEDERFDNFVLDGVGASDEMKAAGLDPTERLPKGYTPAQWAVKKKEVQQQYPGWDVVVSDDGSSTKVVKEEVQQPKPTKVNKPVPPVEKPVQQNILNQTLSYPKNKGVDYKTDGTHWYKKKSGTSAWYTITNDGSITTLNKHFGVNVPKVKLYSYPNKPFEYAVIKGNWHIKKKGDTNWKIIYEPERIKVLNGSFNKKLGVPAKLSEGEKKLNRAAYITKQAGMNMSSPKIGAASVDADGNIFTTAINNAMSTAASTINSGGLFTAPTRPSLIPGSVRAAENVSTENISGIEKNRQLQIDYVNNNPNLSPEKKKAQIDLINKESNALINKEKSSVQGVKEYEKEVTKQVFTAPLPKEVKVKKEIDLSEQINKQFGIEIHNDNIPLLDMNLGLVDRFTDQQKQETFQNAQNFADKDLDAWRRTPQGRILDDQQFKDLKEAQINTRRLIQLGGEDADFSLYGMSTLNSQVEGVADSYKTAVDTNNKINLAAAEGKSMDEFLLDNKKKLAKEIDLNNESMIHAKNLFNATTAIHDFVTPYIKSGKVTIDDNGMYRKSSKMNATESKYFDEKLGGLMQAYGKEKNTAYNTYQDDIAALNKRKNVVNNLLISQRKQLANTKKGTPEYDALVKKINATKERISNIDGQIDNFQNSTRAFFSTDAKGALSSVSSFMGVSGFKAKLLSTNSKLTPKQRFDLAYEAIQEENKDLATRYSINTSYLDAMGAKVRSMLDWNTLGIELSPQEKKWFANQKILNQLLPYYFNNENGVVEESADFFTSFMNSARAMVIGKDIAGAEGNFTGTDQVNTALEAMVDLGFTKEDLANPMAIKDLEKRRNVAFFTGETAGEIIAPTMALVAEIVITKQAGAGALSLSKKLANLVKTVDATGDAIGYGDKVAKMYQSYANVMSKSTFGRYVFDAVEQGVLFEATGQFFGKSGDEMNFASGFAGSLASSAVGDLLGKLPISKTLPMVKAIFGDKTDDAIKVFKKMGEVNATGLGETAEEFTQELVNIKQSQLEGEGFFEAVGKRFGSFDEVMKFVVSSYVMGAGFGMVVPKRAQEAYNSMSEENRERVDDAITAVRKDIEDASAAYDNAAEVLTQEIEIDLSLGAEPESQADIDSKQENAGTLLNGEPTPEAEGKIQEGEVTEAEVEQKKEDDTKDEAGLPSEVREGEKPVETKPFPEASEEEAGPSGVVQEEQEVAPTETELQFELPKGETELQFDLPRAEERAEPILNKEQRDLRLKDRKESIIAEEEERANSRIAKEEEDLAYQKSKLFNRKKINLAKERLKEEQENLELLKSNPEAYFKKMADRFDFYDAENKLFNDKSYAEDWVSGISIDDMPTSESDINNQELKGNKYWIPMSVYEEAYKNDINSKGVLRQSLQQVILRGGYTVKEMNEFLPDWKQRVYELNKKGEGVTESTLTREFDLTEEQVVEEATEQVADIMADEKMSEEQKEEKIDEVVAKTNKRKTAAKMRKGEMPLFPEPSKQLKEEIKAKAEPMVEEKKTEREEVKGEVRIPKKPKLFVSGMARGWRIFNKYDKYNESSRKAEGQGDQRNKIIEIQSGREKPLAYAGNEDRFFFMSKGYDENADKNYLVLADTRLRENIGGGTRGRPGNFTVSVEIDKNASQEEINGAAQYLWTAYKKLYPYIKEGVINERNEREIEEEIVDFETKVASSLLESKVRQRKARKEKQETEAKTATEAPVETKTEAPSLSKKDQEQIKFLDEQIQSTEMRIEDLQEEIQIEKGNLKEEKERIKEEKAKVRSSKMSRDEKQERLEELDSELEDIINDHDDLVQGYKDDISQEKSDLRKYNKDKNKITEKAKAATPAETKTEAPAQPTAEAISDIEKRRQEELNKLDTLKKEIGDAFSGQSSTNDLLRAIGKFFVENFGWKFEGKRQYPLYVSKERNRTEFDVDGLEVNLPEGSTIGIMGGSHYARFTPQEIINAKYDAELKALEVTPTETKTEAPVETKEKSVYDEDGSFTNEYAEQLLEDLVNSAGPRQMSSLTRNLRKAGWDISYGYEQSGLSMSTAIGDSLDLMKREYGVFTKEEKAQATRVLSDMAKRAGIEIEQNVETRAEAPVETKANPFDDLSSVTKLPSRSPKRKQAIADFDAKHGEGAYERVSKIDAKFGEITKKLEDNKVIKKDC